jgi:hypothetical protein
MKGGTSERTAGVVKSLAALNIAAVPAIAALPRCCRIRTLICLRSGGHPNVIPDPR